MYVFIITLNYTNTTVLMFFLFTRRSLSESLRNFFSTFDSFQSTCLRRRTPTLSSPSSSFRDILLLSFFLLNLIVLQVFVLPVTHTYTTTATHFFTPNLPLTLFKFFFILSPHTPLMHSNLIQSIAPYTIFSLIYIQLAESSH